MWSHLVAGLTIFGSFSALGLLIIGSLVGMFVGVVPGLGGAVVLSLILPFVYHMSLTATMCLFLAVYAGGYFSASVTSILLNTPAHPEAFAVTLDGFPMAQRGQGGRALGISATATCVGGLIGCAVLVGFIQVINQLPLIFHPPEYVALVFLALLLVGTLGTDAASKAFVSAGVGLLISTIGPSATTGVLRFTFGSVSLYGGISLVALALGLFALPQMMLVFGTGTAVATQDMLGREVSAATPTMLGPGFGAQVLGGIREALRHWVLLVQSALIGVIAGIIPGIGGFAANFLSYGIAQQTSRKRSEFGTGIAEGIIAPEGSSLAKEAGGMVPVLGLGLPGSVGSALFLAALVIKGVQTGFGFSAHYPVLPYETVWIIALGGVIGTAAGLAAAPVLARITKIPGPLLLPIIMSFAVVGTYVADVSYFSVYEIAVFAIIGFILRRLRYSLASFIIGLVLGPTLEQNIYQMHNLYPGFSFLQRPLADVFFAIAIALVVLKTVQFRREAASARNNAQSAGNEADYLRQLHPYPVLAVTTSACLTAVSAFFVFYAATHYTTTTALLPVVAGTISGIAALWRLPFEIAGYVRLRGTGRAGELPSANSEESGSLARTLSLSPVSPSAPVMPSHLAAVLSTELHAPPDLSAPTVQPSGSPIRLRRWGKQGQYTRELYALAWFAGLIVISYVFGLTVGVIAFCLTYGLAGTGRYFRHWLGRSAFALLSALFLGIATHEIQSLLHTFLVPLIDLHLGI
jgi:putative tricarboxylic transport membrane protein